MENFEEIEGMDQPDFMNLAAEIIAAYVSNNSVPAADLPALISTIHSAIAGLSITTASVELKMEKPTPAQIRKSMTDDTLISFIDGKPYKTLKRHLNKNGLTIEEYRERYGLPLNYPSTSVNYSAQRSVLAKSLGLGNQRRSVVSKAAETVAEAPKARGRKTATAAE